MAITKSTQYLTYLKNSQVSCTTSLRVVLASHIEKAVSGVFGTNKQGFHVLASNPLVGVKPHRFFAGI